MSICRPKAPEGPFIIIEGWAVEFGPPGTPLVEEALAQAVERDVNGVATRVFTAEHLAAICLQVGRAKDHDRLLRFVEAGVLDAEVFEAILQRHELMAKSASRITILWEGSSGCSLSTMRSAARMAVEAIVQKTTTKARPRRIVLMRKEDDVTSPGRKPSMRRPVAHAVKKQGGHFCPPHSLLA